MTADRIFELLCAQARIVIPELSERSIAPTDAMADLGLDSIDRSEVIVGALDKLGLKVRMVDLHGPRNLGELAELLASKTTG